jgi:thiosulfate/3-mercaptopyruvate sulfurtransferase
MLTTTTTTTTRVPLKYWPQSELVSSEWVNNHLQDNDVRIVEVVYNSKNRNIHNSVPGAAVLDWDEDIDHTDYEDAQRQNEKYNKLLKKIGVIDGNTTIVLCSDFNNWFASIAYWIFKHFGNNNVKLLEGGRQAVL